MSRDSSSGAATVAATDATPSRARRRFGTWLALVVMTVGTTTMGVEQSAGAINVVAALAVVVALVKVGMVGWEFMDLRIAPTWLRWMFAAYLVALAIALIVLMLMAPATDVR